jgi:hypothetical protein
MTVTYAAPPAPLDWGSVYGMTVNGKDAQGNPMTEANFTFAVSPQPKVTTVAPAAIAMNVPVTSKVSLGFNVPADHASVEAAFSLKAGTTPVPVACTWATDSTVVNCAPSSALAYSTTYTVSLATGAKSALGDAIAPNALPSTFTTSAVPDTTPPTVVGRDTTTDVATVGAGAFGIGNVLTTAAITIVFSEPVNQAIAQSAFQLNVGGAQTGTFTWDTTGTKMTFQPSAALTHGTTGTWTVAAGVPDTSNNPMATAANGSFHVVNEYTKTLEAEGPWTGYISGTSVSTNSAGCILGDDAANNLVPTLLTFDLAKLTIAQLAIAPTAITGGQLNVTWESSGGSPTTLPGVQAQSVKYAAGGTATFPNPTTAPTLPTDTFCCAPGCRYSCDYYSNFPSPLNWTVHVPQSADVTGILRYQWGERSSRSNFAQFRVVPSASNNNSVQDIFVILGPAYLANPAYRPTLAVKYEYAW